MTATLDKHRTYTPYGGAADLFRCRDGAIIYDGPAGCVDADTILTGSLHTIEYQAENNIEPV